MIYIDLFLTFLKLGAFAFGGAHGAIPLFRTEVLSKGWMSDSVFTNIVAISESTPGPIMVNMATYIGSMQGGLLGSILASLAVVLPSFIIILLVSQVFEALLKNSKFKGVMKGIKQCMVGVIIATGLIIGLNAIAPTLTLDSFDVIALVLFVVVTGIVWAYSKIKNHSISPIAIIVISGVLGGMLY